jgi:two-component system sensor histidine kinase/response regulator
MVEDTGIGLKPEDKEIIFERFRQVELTNNRQYDGAGLGLSISRSLVELMGGDLWVESVEGKGSTFYFTITT